MALLFYQIITVLVGYVGLRCISTNRGIDIIIGLSLILYSIWNFYISYSVKIEIRNEQNEEE